MIIYRGNQKQFKDLKQKPKVLIWTGCLALIIGVYAGSAGAQESSTDNAMESLSEIESQKDDDSTQFEAQPVAPGAQVQDNMIDIDSIEKELEGNLPRSRTKEIPLKASPAKPKVSFEEIKGATPYSDVAIIQRNYMPKTKRFELFGGLSYLTNDVFYKNFGLDLRGAYHFNETWGVEFNYDMLSTIRSKELEGLEDTQRVAINNLVSPKNLYGLGIQYYSTYGKLALWNKKIYSFDIYTGAGVAQVSTGQGIQSTALRASIGELFSLNRSAAIRLDFSWYFYSAKNIEGNTSAVNNLFLTLGYSKFFPDVKDR